MKTVLLAAVFLNVAASAHALPGTVCNVRADMIGAVAGERDKGVPKEAVLKKLQKQLGPRATGIRDYVEGVYLATHMSRDEIREKVFQLCLAE